MLPTSTTIFTTLVRVTAAIAVTIAAVAIAAAAAAAAAAVVPRLATMVIKVIKRFFLLSSLPSS
jgi:hypothetical protein